MIRVVIAVIALVAVVNAQPQWWREPRPCMCNHQYDPVCGVDGRTYSNGCFMKCAGVAFYKDGDCHGSGTIQ